MSRCAVQALWIAAADAKNLRAQLERVHRSSAEIADVEAEDAEHWDRLVRPPFLLFVKSVF